MNPPFLLRSDPHTTVKDSLTLSRAFAHYSGVSRTLAAADPATLAAVQTVLQEISQPFINLEVLALVRQGQPLIIDVDLTGRPVSPTSTTYPDGTSGGWMMRSPRAIRLRSPP